MSITSPFDIPDIYNQIFNYLHSTEMSNEKGEGIDSPYYELVRIPMLWRDQSELASLGASQVKTLNRAQTLFYQAATLYKFSLVCKTCNLLVNNKLKEITSEIVTLVDSVSKGKLHGKPIGRECIEQCVERGFYVSV